MQERKNTHPLSARVGERDAPLSQHVDDVGEEDEAHDGKKHQH